MIHNDNLSINKDYFIIHDDDDYDSIVIIHDDDDDFIIMFLIIIIFFLHILGWLSEGHNSGNTIVILKAKVI